VSFESSQWLSITRRGRAQEFAAKALDRGLAAANEFPDGRGEAGALTRSDSADAYLVSTAAAADDAQAWLGR
jgi:hypothetical protein